MIHSHHPVVDAARVHDRLWVGSHPVVAGHHCDTHPHESPVPNLVAEGFSALILCSSAYQPPASAFPGVLVVHAPFDDDSAGLDARGLATALSAVEKAVEAHDAGHNVLVTCTEGRNRAGLVGALTLAVLAEIPAAQAGAIVREKRGLAALSNMAFRDILATTQISR